MDNLEHFDIWQPLCNHELKEEPLPHHKMEKQNDTWVFVDRIQASEPKSEPPNTSNPLFLCKNINT